MAQFFNQKQKDNEEEAQYEKWLICVDPKSKMFYTVNSVTNELHIETDADDVMQDAAKKAINDLRQIIDYDKSSWLFESEQAKRFQRRKIPSYLLHKDSSEYPTYLCQSNLSLAFANVNSIKLVVLLGNYEDKLLDWKQEPPQNEKKQEDKVIKDEKPQKYEKRIEIEAGLVTGADEVIKNILREIFKQAKVKLEPNNPDHQFILQIKGFREYLTGNYPMLSYDRVRINLRGHEHLDVRLTEIPIKSRKADLFPPTIMRKKTDVANNKYQKVNWKKFHGVSILLWYPWIEFPEEKDIDQKSLEAYNKKILTFKLDFTDEQEQQIRNNVPPLPLSQLNGSGENEEARKRAKSQIQEQPEPVIFEEIPHPINICLQKCIQKEKKKQYKLDGTLNYKNEYLDSIPMKDFVSVEENYNKMNQKKLTSGECDCLFRIRICSIENVFKILKSVSPELEDKTKEAVYNGIMQPSYITKSKQEDINKHQKSRKQVQKKDKKKEINLKLCKIRKEKLLKDAQMDTSITNHGIDGVAFMGGLEKKFGLNCTPYLVSLKVMLFHGSNCLRIVETKKQPFCKSIRFNEWVTFDNLKISQIPLEARICMNIILHSDDQNEHQIIGSTSFSLFDQDDKYRQGLNALNIWPFYRIQNRLCCMSQYWGLTDKSLKLKQVNEKEMQDFISKNFTRVFVQLEKFNEPLYYSLRDDDHMKQLGFPKLSKRSNGGKNWNSTPKTDDLARLQQLLSIDPLRRLSEQSEEDKHVLMICRNHYKTLTHTLQIFLFAIDWLDPEQVKEAILMLKQWTLLSPEDALPLLDANMANESVRLYAVERVSTFSDDEIALYMLELTQSILYESKHFSPLVDMLLERSLQNPFVVGHELFWQLKSQLHIKAFYERYFLIIEQMLMLCGSFRNELVVQVGVNDQIKKIGQEIQDESLLKEHTLLVPLTKKKLSEIKLPEEFSFALDSRMQVQRFEIDDCRCMNSKKVPLWIATKSKEDENINILFKCGDDIRQDQLTLQLLKIMDKIWLDAGHDFRMKPYKVITTDDQVGMIEIVNNSETTARIHSKYGGVLGAFRNNTIWQYLKDKNMDPHSFEIATDNFLRSCAGYCVATYILGIGDRHADNIMLSQTGHLFHIDFGHFLGNFKTKFGIKRERAPFVLTKEMAFVMGGKDGNLFRKFEEYCTQAYNLVRKSGNFIINIFLLMLEAGMPELQSPQDIEYLRNQLSINLTEQEATNKFKKEITDSLNSLFRRIDNFFHALRRRK
ncbi:hypothetical protein ABPG72_002645 [Tetrahymena utriculariae]